jgi:hypothetical protein
MFLKRPDIDQYTVASQSARQISITGVNIDYSHEWLQMNKFPKEKSFIRDTLDVNDINGASQN